jgi:hypothetical protein
MIPHRPPSDVPVHLLDPAERQALADHGGTDWARANRASFAATEAERAQVREFGLVVRRGPANLGEHHVDDALGREVLRELAKRQRGG